jgi:hypothetical protein
MMRWLRLARNTALALTALAVLIGVSGHHTGIPYFRLRVTVCFLLALAMTGLLSLMQKHRTLTSYGSAFLAAVLLFGFTGWITAWLNFGMGRQKMDITVTSGEVQGLRKLHDLTRPEEAFATNQHSIDGIPIRPERSYGYSTLSERPVLLEGYRSRGEMFYPWFNRLLEDNDRMFSTTDPQVVHTIAQAYHIHWLVTRPGTDIALPRPLPSWLAEQPDSGTLKIYRVN